MLIPAARAGKLFGNDGGLTLTLYPAFPDNFTMRTPLFVRIDALDVPLWCEQFERRGVTGAVVRFADIDTARRAAELVGKELFIEQEEEVDDEFYMEDLIGFRAMGFEAAPAVDLSAQTQPGSPATSCTRPQEAPRLAQTTCSSTQCGKSVAKGTESSPSCAVPVHKTFTGRVTDYYDSEANPLLEVTTDEGDEVLVPAAEEFIARIDFEERLIEFILPEGLMDLNRK